MEATPRLWLSVGEEGQDVAGKLVPGLRRIKDLGREFLIEQPPDFVSELRTKREAFEDPLLRAEILQCLPSSLTAQHEALDMILDHLSLHYPHLYNIDKDKRLLEVLPTAERHLFDNYASFPLELAARIVQEDIVIMQPGVEGGHAMSCAAVCFSFSAIKDKIGKPLSFLHASVPGFEEQLLPLVERTLTLPGLSPSTQGLWRVNWGFADHDRLDPREVAYGHHTEFSKRDDLRPQELCLKVEYQTLRRLPKSQAVLFTIRTFVESLDKATSLIEGDEGSRVAASLHHSLSGMNPAIRGYKGLGGEGSAEKMLDFLHSRIKKS